MKSIDAKTFLLMLRGGAERLDQEKERVNSLNVFPVPDGDTGTNMALTMQAALRAAEECGGDHLGRIAKAAARGALLGARGNSGVILSQFFSGLADALEDVEEADTFQIVQALESAANAAYKAVLKPVEGTMLSVGRAGAEAARQAAEQGLDLSKVLVGAFEGARKMLEQTPRILEVLREAGVVDAGGEGLLVAAYGGLGALQNGAASALAKYEESKGKAASASASHRPSLNGAESGAHGIQVAEDITFKYCTEFLVHGESLDSTKIQKSMLRLEGDSLLVVGDDKVVKVHIHTNEPWIALETCARFGELAEISIDNMVLQNLNVSRQSAAAIASSASDLGKEAEKRSVPVAAVAVVQGEGFRSILADLGCGCFVEGGQSMNPSTEEILAAVEAVEALHVILLPNNRNIRLAAEQVVRLSSKRVDVLPTSSIPEAIAAMMAFNLDRPVEKMIEDMRRSLESVRVGEVTRAVRDAKMNGWTITAGQVIGIAEGNIVSVGSGIDEAMLGLLRALDAESCEIATLYYGADVTEQDAEGLARKLRDAFPDLEIEIYSGGQPIYEYLVALE